MRKLIALLLLLSLVTVCLGAAFAETSEPEQHTSEGFTYIILDDGTAEITGFSGETEDNRLRIPVELDGYAVTSIGDRAFYGRDDLTEVRLLACITKIGDYAFAGCSQMGSIWDTFEVSSIGEGAFMDCGALRNYYIPDGCTNIGNNTFRNCRGLLSINIPSSVTNIGETAFEGCSLIVIASENSYAIGYAKENKMMYTIEKGSSTRDTETTGQSPRASKRIDGDGYSYYILEDGTAELKDYYYAAKSGNDEQGTLIIPEEVDGYKVTVIGCLAFSKREDVVKVIIPDSVIVIGDTSFSMCPSLKEVVLGNSVATIGSAAFGYCDNLTHLTIPESVTSIAFNAFWVMVMDEGKRLRIQNPALTLTVSRDSAIEKYCIDNGIKYVYSDE